MKKYKALYSTLIGGEFKKKDEVFDFPKSTDSGFIHRLLKEKVIAEAQEENPQDEVLDEIEKDENPSSDKKKKVSKS